MKYWCVKLLRHQGLLRYCISEIPNYIYHFRWSYLRNIVPLQGYIITRSWFPDHLGGAAKLASV